MAAAILPLTYWEATDEEVEKWLSGDELVSDPKGDSTKGVH